MVTKKFIGTIVASLILLSMGQVLAQDSGGQSVPITVDVVPLEASDPTCSGAFVPHTLDHMTTVPGGEQVRMFEANGGGVGINDLDNDGDLDIVLANHADANTILWNEGDLSFRTERMAHGDSRAVTIVDVDGDGWLDIVFTRRATALNYWHNLGDQRFEQLVLPDISLPLYTINWADVDGDGDLDFVGATYDAGLLSDMGQEFLSQDFAGVYYYENDQGYFRPQRLADGAQALALVLVDLNDDEQLDILVGNDFAVPDQVWHWVDGRWQEADNFAAISHSTMSFDFADITNDGSLEIFSTDMKPYAHDEQTMAAWQPIMQSMMDDPHIEGDPQVMSNVLQTHGDVGYIDQAAESGIDGTGWSWSAKFGDLNQDGFLDLYIVNGMIESTTFAHLPNHELVEENQAFQNDGTGQFISMPGWNLGSTASGRGMSMADVDNDGDLDIVVNNLRASAQLFENQLCEGSSLQVDLIRSDSGNTHALGARLELHTSVGIMYRQVRAMSGYLSGDPSRIHFGFPEGTVLEQLVITWSDGKNSVIDDLSADVRLTILGG